MIEFNKCQEAIFQANPYNILHSIFTLSKISSI